ncbi:MAG: HAD family phosphatase [Candidatus Omnitrophica bacterium]|nr:HAD family phosphatase [Candidatus Omnitrophota bacterium]
MSKKVFAFDLGRVLFDFDIRIALRALGSTSEMSQEKILEAIYYENFGVEYEKGLITNFEFYKRFSDKFGLKNKYEDFTEAWCGMFSPKNEMIEFVAKLRRMYPLYMISNISDLHFEYLFEKYRYVFDYFRGLVLSFKERSVKPEEKIYKTLETLCGVPRQDIIYIDDRQDLIEAAEGMGFCSIQFKDLARLIEDLEKAGIALP